MLNECSGTIYIGELTNKFSKDYKTSKGDVGVNYELVFAILGSKIIIRCNKEVYQSLNENTTYVLPIGIRSFHFVKDGEHKAGVSYYVRMKDTNILDVDGNLVEIK